MEDVLDKALEWTRGGREIALATVVGTWGSSPRPVGSQLAVNDEGTFAGSVSGGCIEGAVITEALDVIGDGRPRLLEFSVENERAWEVGLTCGGTVQVLLAKGPAADFLAALQRERSARRPAVLVTNVETGTEALVSRRQQQDGSALPAPVLDAAREALGGRRSRFVELDGARHFLRVYPLPPKLVVVGAVHVAQALAPMARLAGLEAVVIDPRQAFATEERFPNLDPIAEWPDDYFTRQPLDAATAVATLTHDPKLDDPALKMALGSDAFYVGALGSRKTHGLRVARLQKRGLGAERIATIHAPIGLDLGGRQPGEIALAILAEIVQAWNRR